MKFKVGFGYDVHQLQEGRKLFIGGIEIPHSKGAVGYSDADVLLHAICDALLGAASLRDIGWHFPDNDPQYKGIDSKLLLRRVSELLQNKQFNIGNIDATVCLEKPKISPYIEDMTAVISQILGIPTRDVSVKATTTEKMGFVGRGEGISAYAVVLIYANL